MLGGTLANAVYGPYATYSTNTVKWSQVEGIRVRLLPSQTERGIVDPVIGTKSFYTVKFGPLNARNGSQMLNVGPSKWVFVKIITVWLK